ncbi:Heterokaryon incompatibility protein (HET) domain containing protein [Naviculisporaceae sp. PSN 640]
MSTLETCERFANCNFCNENKIVAHLLNTASNHGQCNTSVSADPKPISCALGSRFHGPLNSPEFQCPFNKLVEGLLSPHTSIIDEARPSLFSSGFQLVPFTETQTPASHQKRGYEVKVSGQIEGRIVVGTPLTLDVLPSDKTDLKTRFTKFISDCQANHSTCDLLAVNYSSSPPLPELFLVDVVKKCLVKAPTCTSPRYIALSYVWGYVEQFNTTKGNVEQLQQPGALTLEQVRSQISQVILDAMEFVTLVGERYLWVDTLCIIQNDAEFKDRQIKSMGAIYTRSLTCICVIAGRDATAGLPGIRVDSTPLQRARIGENVDIVAMRPDLRSELQDSVYETRAWTYQERIMAPRLIFFTDWAIHFDCWQSNRLFNPLCDLLGTRAQDLEHSTKNLDLRFFEAYSALVEQYTQRRVRPDRSQDRALAAAGLWEITGQCHFLTQSSEFHSGICSRFLEFSLLWVEMSKDDLTGAMVYFAGMRNDACPSWSWAGVLNPVNYSFAAGIFRVQHYCGYSFQSCMRSVVHEIKDSNSIGCPKESPGPGPGAYITLSFRAMTVCCSNGGVFGYIRDQHFASMGIQRSFIVYNEKDCGVIYSEHHLNLRGREKLDFVQLARLEAPILEGVDEDDWPCERIHEPLVPSDYLQGQHLILVLLVTRRDKDHMERLGCGMILETAWESAQAEETTIRLF